MCDDQYAHHNVASSRAALQLDQPPNTKVNASAVSRVSLLTGCISLLATMGACHVHQADHNKITIIHNHCAANCGEGSRHVCASKVCYRTLQSHIRNSVHMIDKHEHMVQATACEQAAGAGASCAAHAPQ